MVLRRPYAFLIKYFKVIHLILFGLLVYITMSASGVLNFFRDYINSNGNMEVIASKYFSPFITVCFLLVIFISVFIFMLMRYKKKPKFFYVIVVIVSLVSGFVFTYLHGNVKDLETGIMSAREIRLLRDISRFNYWGLLILCIPVLIRGLGFDIKKFNFSSDMIDLKLDKTDNEEIEINTNISSDSFKRIGSKFAREMKYYYLENKFLLNIIFGIILFILVLRFPFNKFVIHRTLGEGDTLSTENFNLIVEDSYISSRHATSKNNSYVILKTSVMGKSSKYSLRTDEFVLKGKKNEYIPSLKYYYYFTDIGSGYYKENLNMNEYTSYIFIYNIDNSDKASKYIIRYLGNNRKIKIKPTEIS